eukprot:2354057-Amphidinium_carterae.1
MKLLSCYAIMVSCSTARLHTSSDCGRIGPAVLNIQQTLLFHDLHRSSFRCIVQVLSRNQPAKPADKIVGTLPPNT